MHPIKHRIKRPQFLVLSLIWLMATHVTFATTGYRGTVAHEDGYIAVDSIGRVDWLLKDASIHKSAPIPATDLRCVLSTPESILVGGANGALFVSTNNETFTRIDCNTDYTLHALAYYNNKVLIGSDQGILFTYDKGNVSSIQLPLKGNIRSLCVRESDCFGVTDEGEIIQSIDGKTWTVFDFNEYYKGYYDASSFTRVASSGDRIFVTGTKQNGLPIVIFSSEGTIWVERTITYSDEQGRITNFETPIYDMAYDVNTDLFVLTCANGLLMTIPSCSHCNKAFYPAYDHLTGVARNKETFLIVGTNGFRRTLEHEW
jgi:hypothetical protein